MPQDAALRCLCGKQDFETVFEYREPPAGEVRFDLAPAQGYRRRILRCRHCGHFQSVHAMDMSALYSGAYVDATYGAAGLRRAFERIVSLPPEKSDNADRVRYVIDFAARRFGRERCLPGNLSVLDVGSGLCVFLHLLKKRTGWNCLALDPDARAAAHARDVAGVDAVTADFMGLEAVARYDMLTFNKVLEHVVDPVAMLGRAAAHLGQSGVVYIELPDGEAAAVEGPGREEFFIDHHHVFSPESMRILAQRAGFEVLEMERLREPSSKFTLRAFLGVEADDRQT